jgi:membrane-bound inhibitor of C-type lysozyme
VPTIPVSRVITANYHCPGGKQFSITYLNADDGQSLAVVPYRDKSMFSVSTTSADGVKYQADSITRWIRGCDDTLFDVRSDANNPILYGYTSK